MELGCLEGIASTISWNTSKIVRRYSAFLLPEEGGVGEMTWDSRSAQASSLFRASLGLFGCLVIHALGIWNDWADFLSTTCCNEPKDYCPFKWAPWETVSSFLFSYDSTEPLLWQVPSREEVRSHEDICFIALASCLISDPLENHWEKNLFQSLKPTETWFQMT